MRDAPTTVGGASSRFLLNRLPVVLATVGCLTLLVRSAFSGPRHPAATRSPADDHSCGSHQGASAEGRAGRGRCPTPHLKRPVFLAAVLALTLLGGAASGGTQTIQPESAHGTLQAVPASDSIAAAVADSKARIASLTTSAVDCAPPARKGVFEKTAAYEARVAATQAACREAERRTLELASKPFILPLVGATVRYDAESAHFLLALAAPDGQLRVRLDGPIPQPLALSDGPAVPWVCRVPWPRAEGEAREGALRLLLRYNFTPPLPARQFASWTAQDARLVGVRQERGGDAVHVVFDTSLTTCAVPRSATYEGSWIAEYGGFGDVYRTGAGIENPQVLREVRPEYTKAAMDARIQGIVVLECVVLENGSVGEVRVTKSLDRIFGLDQKAIEAARQWRFVPGKMKMSGQPVKVFVLLELTFKLK